MFLSPFTALKRPHVCIPALPALLVCGLPDSAVHGALLGFPRAGRRQGFLEFIIPSPVAQKHLQGQCGNDTIWMQTNVA